MAQPISNLAVGDKVKMGTLYGAPIVWLVADKDHVGYPANSVTLITAQVVKFLCFDAPEPNNLTRNEYKSYGYPRWMYSNIRNWLNSAAGAGAWYSAQHQYDDQPGSARVDNPYILDAGFLNGFTEKERSILLDTTNKTRDSYYGTNGVDTSTEKIYIPSLQECDVTPTWGSWSEGQYLRLFLDKTKLNGGYTPQAKANDQIGSTNQFWWTRTLDYELVNTFLIINTNGPPYFATSYPNSGNVGVRPCCNVTNAASISDAPDSDGAYTLIFNQPPGTPASISFGTPRGGKTLALTCAAATDPDGEAVSYVWERRIDSGAWTQIGITSVNAYNDTVPSSGGTYNARVKTSDGKGGESDYRTGAAQTINHNVPPTLTGSDESRGAITAPFSYAYTATDANAGDTITITEAIDGADLRTFTAASGTQYTANIAPVWLKLTNGAHTLTITARDREGESVTRTITFARSVTRIAAARTIQTTARANKVFISLFPKPAAGDATITCQVCNNPFDTSPAWEDISGKVNEIVHIFANTTVATTPGIGYRFTITPAAGKTAAFFEAVVRYA